VALLPAPDCNLRVLLHTCEASDLNSNKKYLGEIIKETNIRRSKCTSAPLLTLSVPVSQGTIYAKDQLSLPFSDIIQTPDSYKTKGLAIVLTVHP
jgi:hypothetical protein